MLNGAKWRVIRPLWPILLCYNVRLFLLELVVKLIELTAKLRAELEDDPEIKQ